MMWLLLPIPIPLLHAAMPLALDGRARCFSSFNCATRWFRRSLKGGRSVSGERRRQQRRGWGAASRRKPSFQSSSEISLDLWCHTDSCWHPGFVRLIGLFLSRWANCVCLSFSALSPVVTTHTRHMPFSLKLQGDVDFSEIGQSFVTGDRITWQALCHCTFIFQLHL